MATITQKPEFEKSSFICPSCGAFAHMVWGMLYEETKFHDLHGFDSTDFYACRCISCGKSSLWEEARTDDGNSRSGIAEMLHPTTMTAPPPHPDLPEACSRDYSEARSIAQASPRGAAALLRLCIQKLCVELGQPGSSINSDIAALVKEGLPTRVQQALDIVRVVGNQAVHPGVMTEEDHADQVHTLFDLVNIIVEQMISQPQRLENMFASLPEGAREAIAKRDSKK